MTRNNIFQLLKSKIDFTVELKRIAQLMTDYSGIRIKISSKNFDGNYDHKHMSIEKFADNFAFKSWLCRGTCISCDDMKEALNLEWVDDMDESYTASEDEVLNYCEYASNILYITTLVQLTERYTYKGTDIYAAAKTNITQVLDWLNYEAKIFESEQKVLVIQKNAASTAVAEILDREMGYKVIQYNHHALRGDIDTKKSILLAMGAELEPKRKLLDSINKTLSSDIFYMLNNLNLRHNNRSKNDKNYKSIVANMRKQTLESWYDELYQMMLLAFLEISQQDRATKVKDLKNRIENAT